MTPRQKRFAFVAAGLVAIGLATFFILNAFKAGVMLFYSPTDVVAGKAPQHKTIRLGGMVEKGSLQRQPDDLTVHFVVTDLAEKVTVSYTGILPDLFTEGQGVVAQGRMSPDGLFMASEVLAKHDETYMPPEVADALEKGKQRAAQGAGPVGGEI